MINPLYEKLAKLAVNYSINVKKGDRVFILGSAIAAELFRALYVEIIKAGGHALLYPLLRARENYSLNMLQKNKSLILMM